MRSMKFLFLLVLSVAPAMGGQPSASDVQLAEVIVKTEVECNNLENLQLKKNEYTELRSACDESLDQDKYRYILNNFEPDKYAELGDEFPVQTSQGEKMVRKPPQLSVEDMAEKTRDFETKKTLLEQPYSKVAQELVDQKIKCELEESNSNCINTLNCLKDKFMEDNNLELKANLIDFMIMYKGKQVKITSPPDTQRDCKGSAPKENTEGSAAADVDGSAPKENTEEEDEFAALDRLDDEAPKTRGSTKMVTKSVDAPANDQMNILGAVAKGLLGGGKGGGNDMTGALLAMAAPSILSGLGLGGGKGKKGSSPLGFLAPAHLNTLTRLATNALKPKESRDRIAKAEIKAVVEVITKTAVHFAILSFKAKETIEDENKKKPRKNRFLEIMEVALVDALAAGIVDCIVEIFIPDDPEEPVKPIADDKAKPSSGGFLDKLTGGKSKKEAEKTSSGKSSDAKAQADLSTTIANAIITQVLPNILAAKKK